MLPDDRIKQLLDIPLKHLVTDLIRQFNKPTLLGQRGINFTKAEMDSLAEKIAKHEPLPETVTALQQAMANIIEESVTELQSRFGLTFAESLAQTDMSKIGKWETTAEFLEVANHKSNAELRIAAGASLMAFLRDVRFADHLFTVLNQDEGLGDVDAIIAKRALSHYTQVDISADDWSVKVKSALAQKPA